MKKQITFLATTLLLFATVVKSNAQEWHTTGNTGTNPATNFIGTIDGQPINFRIGNQFSGKIEFTTLHGTAPNDYPAGGTTSYGYMSSSVSAYNTSAFGAYALSNNTSGQNNSAFGSGALMHNTTGTKNTAFGSYALRTNTLGNYNAAIGSEALVNNTTGESNVALGNAPLSANTTGSYNIAIGEWALLNTTTASSNIAIGRDALRYYNGTGVTDGSNIAVGGGAGLLSGHGNCFFGASSGPASSGTGSNNVCLGNSAGNYLTTGSQNTIIGPYSGGSPGGGLTTGSYNVVVGNTWTTTGSHNVIFGEANFLTTGSQNSIIGKVRLTNIPGGDGIPVASTNTMAGMDTSNSVIIADGYFNQKIFIHSNGFTGIGLGNNVIPQNRLEVNGATTIGYVSDGTTAGIVTAPAGGLLVSGKVGIGNKNPQNKVEITSGVPCTSGLRFTNLTSDCTPTVNKANVVLSVNNLGDVILVNDQIGTAGVTNSCTNLNFLPKTSTTTGNLTCSQIFDNGTSVGIGYPATNSFSYTWSGGLTGATLPATSGTLKLDINGVARGLAFMATSDKKFKKNIKPIENALDKVLALDGKTYNWRKDEFKDKNFTDELQYGLIAQEVQKVIPSIVIKDGNGDLAMNYTALIPVLIEAMKDQQTQINDLKTQLSEKFVSQNNDLIQLNNTKIISVSPNPSSSSIMVSLNIDKEVQTATLQVFDLKGTMLNSLNIKERENNINKTLQKDNFGSGVYIVSLVVNGKSIDSKKIIFE